VSHVSVEPWGVVEELVLASGSGPERLRKTILDVGLERTVDVIINEFLLRFNPPRFDGRANLQLEVTVGGDRVGWVLTAQDGKVRFESGWADSADAHIGFDAVDLVASMFGPFERARHASRSVTWSREFMNRPAPTDMTELQGCLEPWQRLSPIVHAVLSAFTAQPVNLGELSVRFGSDKWAHFHWYTQHYERHFAPLRNDPVRVLEIGVGGYDNPEIGGGSLRMWQLFFPRGLVYGLDLFEKPHTYGPRTRTIQGDQSDPKFLNELGCELGPFDIIIDDGSHVNDHVKTSFRSLFPHVRPGGLYIIEDLQTAYWPGYGGNDHDLHDENTSLTMLKDLVDGLNHQDLPHPDGRAFPATPTRT